MNGRHPMDDHACPGPENKPYRDAWETYEAALQEWQDQVAAHDAQPPHARSARPDPPQEPDLTPVAGDPVWCPRHTTTIRAALVDIGDLAAVLEQWADGRRGRTSGERIPTRRTTAPSPSPITDTLDELYGALAKVEADWREAAGHSPRPNRARTGDARQRTIAYLLEQLPRILMHPGSAAFGLATLAWQRRLQLLTTTDPVRRRRPGRCPRCRCVNTLQTRDDGYTECQGCGRLMDEDEYQRDVVGAAGEDVVRESRQERQAAS